MLVYNSNVSRDVWGRMSDQNISVNTEAALRLRIVTGEIEPDTWLRENAIAELLGVSRTPVREACSRLARDGLLEWTPRRGFRLPALDPDELDAVYPVLIALEVLAVDLIAEPLERLASDLRADELDLAKSPSGAWAAYEVDRLWHRRIIEATVNPVLVEFHDRLVERIARHLFAHWASPSDDQRSSDEHLAIATALSRGDQQLAAALLSAHRRYGREHIRALITSQETEARASAKDLGRD